MIKLINNLLRSACYRWLTAALIVGLLVPLPVYPQAPFVVCSDPDSPSDDPALGCTLNDLLAVPVRIYNYLLGMAAILLLAVIAWSGLRMMLFYLAEAPESELAAAKLTLMRGIWGFLIVACAYLIVSIVLGVLKLDTGSVVYQVLSKIGIFPASPL